MNAPGIEGPDETVPKGIMGLIEAWQSDRDPFDDYVRGVSKAYYGSHLGLEAAAGWVDTTPAELAAVLILATMEDEDLKMLAANRPPKSTWLLLADQQSQVLRAALDALDERSESETAFYTVQRTIREVAGPSTENRVANLDPDVFFLAAKKAKQYNVLSGKARKALVDFGKWRSRGKELTPAQTAYAMSLLKELVDAGAFRRDSPDKDQEICDQLLDALGR